MLDNEDPPIENDDEDLPEIFKQVLKSSKDIKLIIINSHPLAVLKETSIAPGIILLTFIEPHLKDLITTRVLCGEGIDFLLDGFSTYGLTREEALKNHEEVEFYVRAELQFRKL